VQWEYFFGWRSPTLAYRVRLNKQREIRSCDIVLLSLFYQSWKNIPAEEFDTAYETSKDQGKPRIWDLLLRNADIIKPVRSTDEKSDTLLEFKKKIGASSFSLPSIPIPTDADQIGIAANGEIMPAFWGKKLGIWLNWRKRGSNWRES